MQFKRKERYRDRLKGAVIAVAVVTVLSLCPASSKAGCGEPTFATITPDGSFEDWPPVLSNTRNTTEDGNGSSVPCPESADLDCVVPAARHDLRRFAWTYDGAALYLFVER